MTVRIAPSILSADFANLEAEFQRIASADVAHIDVMDGHFVPNLTIGQPVVGRLKAISPLPLDVHLMIDNPDRWAADYVDAGAASISFHIEAAQAPVRLARQLRAAGIRVGVALRPTTPLGRIEDLLDEVDQVLLLSVEPGFGGQTFIERSLDRIARVCAMADSRGLNIDIEVDGGITTQTAPKAVAAGANILVAGSAVFDTGNPADAIEALRASASTHA